MKLLVNHLLFLLIVLLFQSNSMAEGAYEGHFVDAYSCTDASNEDPAIIVRLMEESKVSHTVVAPKGGSFHAEASSTATKPSGVARQATVDLANEHPDKIIPVTIANMKLYRRNEDGYADWFYEYANEADYKGIAETPIYVGQEDYRPESIIVPFDDWKISILTATARSEKWPMHLWVNFSDMPDNEKNAWMKNFKTFLSENPDITFLLLHLGTLPSKDIAALIAEHQNLYFLLSRTTPDFEAMETKYTMILDKNGSLKSDWKALFVEHPDRFLVAFYTFGIDWSELYPRIIYVWRNILGELPKEIAHAIAHGNAERIYNIKVEKKNTANTDFGSNVDKLTKNNMSVSSQ